MLTFDVFCSRQRGAGGEGMFVSKEKVNFCFVFSAIGIMLGSDCPPFLFVLIATLKRVPEAFLALFS